MDKVEEVKKQIKDRICSNCKMRDIAVCTACQIDFEKATMEIYQLFLPEPSGIVTSETINQTFSQEVADKFSKAVVEEPKPALPLTQALMDIKKAEHEPIESRRLTEQHIIQICKGVDILRAHINCLDNYFRKEDKP